MEIKSDYFLSKFVNQKKNVSSEYDNALCYLYMEMGYEETLELPIPVFIKIVEYLNEKGRKESGK
ncbi:MAG: hypothetical protein U9O94_04000 [Nanoarchaeota archaeon]|nr:hypothetical protein [Nanoarchaeota archaeon]